MQVGQEMSTLECVYKQNSVRFLNSLVPVQNFTLRISHLIKYCTLLSAGSETVLKIAFKLPSSSMNSDISGEIVAFDLIGGKKTSMGRAMVCCFCLELVSRELNSMGYCNGIGLIYTKPEGYWLIESSSGGGATLGSR